MPALTFRRLIAVAALTLPLASVAACNPADPVAPAPKPSETATYEARILTLVNAERAKAHLNPLALIGCADGYANSWARTMASTGDFEHQALAPILKACSARGAGENIAYGNVTPEAMMSMWMHSPGHRANLLNPSFTDIGIGAAKTAGGRWYGVQDFVTR